jgi:colanic acid/amylovoran biosynthesis glycosyltransferase
VTGAELPTVAHVMRAYLAGTETFVRNQVVAPRRHRAVVVAHHRRPRTPFPLEAGAVAAERLPRGLALLDAGIYRTTHIASPASIRTLARYVREQDARLLHYHFLTDARFLLALEARTGLPAIASAYGWDVSLFPKAFGGLGRRYLRPIFGRLDAFLAMSEDMRRDLLALGCPDEKIIVHYHGVDTRRFWFPERDYSRQPLTILTVGRLERRKAQDVLLRALRRVERSGAPPFRVVVVGEGGMRGALERLVAEYGWQERVTLTGHIPYSEPGLVAQFRRADVFALPSITSDGLKEGIPGTIVEAMASGLPVVGSHHAGIPAIIEHRRHGLLVRERDVEGLADALATLLSDAALRERLGRAAAERAADELDLAACTRELERLYDRFT